MRHGIALFACITTLFLHGCGGAGDQYQVAAPEDIVPDFNAGDTAVLAPRPEDEEEDPAAPTYFAKNFAAMRELTVVWTTKPEQRQEMIAKGDLFQVSAPAQCEILERRAPGYRIKLTDGEYAGKTGWAWEVHLRKP